METKRTVDRYDAEPYSGFDVVCTIGHVSIGHGDQTPTEAAFLLIAQHDAPGLYSFPGPDEGMTIRVEVEHVR